MPRRRIRITISYDGTAYSGWQVQPGRRTIQDTIQKIVSGFEGKPVYVGSSGRTDAGVHAYAQVAAFDLDNPIPCENLRKAINRLLPDDIRILHAEEVHWGFHARHDAVAKTYEYRIFRGEICSPFERRYVCHHPFPLNEVRMSAAAELLEGEHDFTAFAAYDPRVEPDKCRVRTIFSSRAESRENYWIYRVRGSGFLKYMVRNIVGMLLEVGKGNLSNSDVSARLIANSGIRPLQTMPPEGLFMISVEYPQVSPGGESESGK